MSSENIFIDGTCITLLHLIGMTVAVTETIANDIFICVHCIYVHNNAIQFSYQRRLKLIRQIRRDALLVRANGWDLFFGQNENRMHDATTNAFEL